MKKLIITSIVLFIGFIAFGQNEYENITTGSIFKDQTKWTRVLFSENDGNGGVVLVRTFHVHSRTNAKAFYLEHYDSDLKLIKRKKINKASKNILINEGIINIILFEQKGKAGGYEFNLLSGSLSSMSFKEENLSSVGKEEMLGMSLYASPKSFDVAAFGNTFFSENKNYIALSFDIKNDDVATHKIVVFNKKFEKVNEYMFKVNIGDDFFDFQDVTVDDKDGTLYILGKVFENNSRKLEIDNKIKYHFETYKLTKESQEKVVFNNKNNFIKSLKPILKGDKLSYVGLYGKDKESKSSGVCNFNIDAQKFELVNNSFNKFSNQFILDKYGKASDKELKNLVLNDIHMLDNGDVIITGEEYYDKYGQKTGATYHYDDIILLKIDNEGKLIWSRNINKEQFDTYFNISSAVHASYHSFLKNDKIYLFFNASDKINESKKGDVEFKEFKRGKSAIYKVIIDGEGNYNYKNIYQDKSSDVLYHFKDMVIDKDENLILFGDAKIDKQLIKIEK